MAKVSSIEKNKARKRLIERQSSRRSALKKQMMDKSLSMEEHFRIAHKMAELPRNGAHIRYRNRCFETGRARGYLRALGLSRIKAREHMLEGELPGWLKDSW